MLIFGTRNVRSTVETGTFFCPVCQQTTNYKHITNRNFGHLFFIPLLPLGGSEEYVECQRCGTPFGVEVLSDSPAMEQGPSEGDFHKLVLDCMQLVAAIDASISAQEVQTIGHLYKQVAGQEAAVDSAWMRRESEKLRYRADEVYAEVKRLAPTLNEEKKEVLVRVLILVAFSDNQPTQIEYDCIAQIGQSLRMTQDELKNLVQATIKVADASRT